MFSLKVSGYSVIDIIRISGLTSSYVRQVFNLIEPDVKSENINDKRYTYGIVNHLLYSMSVDLHTIEKIFDFNDFEDCLKLSKKFNSISEKDTKILYNNLAKQNIFNQTASIILAYNNLIMLINQGYSSKEDEYIRVVNLLVKSIEITHNQYLHLRDTAERLNKQAENVASLQKSTNANLILLLENPLKESIQLLNENKHHAQNNGDIRRAIYNLQISLRLN